MLTDPVSDLALLTAQADASYFTFRARPDQPDRYDQQTAFIDSQAIGVSWLIGGNGAGTTECAIRKVAKFVMDTPPPRADTPFWLISDTYEQVMDALWKEKLYGHGHIPHSEVDWDRVSWYKPNQNWPFRVPLLPWPNRPNKNWVLEFKSYEQGRQRLQARSIGGFCFSEQFPYELLTEVLRGCREYNFPGSKFCEFTPIDPALSAPIEEMIENDALPPGWEVFRAKHGVRCRSRSRQPRVVRRVLRHDPRGDAADSADRSVRELRGRDIPELQPTHAPSRRRQDRPSERRLVSAGDRLGCRSKQCVCLSVGVSQRFRPVAHIQRVLVD